MGWAWVPVYTENFESYAVGTSLIGIGNQQWTVRGGATSFAVIAGKAGNITEATSNWGNVSCNDSDLVTLADCKIEFDVVSYAGGRWAFFFRQTAAGGYVIQHAPGLELTLRRTNSWGPLGETHIHTYVPPPASIDHVKIELVGTNIKLWLNDVYQGEVIDAIFTAGTIGLRTWSAGWAINNIVVSVYKLIAEPAITTVKRGLLKDVGITWDRNAVEGVATFNPLTNDLVEDDGLATAVYVSLFTDARAHDDDDLPGVLQPEDFPDRRGWWGDKTSERENDSVGSRLWLLERSKSSNENLRRAESYAKEALQWMLDENAAADIKCLAEFGGNQNQQLRLLVQIIKISGETLSYRFESLWEEMIK